MKNPIDILPRIRIFGEVAERLANESADEIVRLRNEVDLLKKPEIRLWGGEPKSMYCRHITDDFELSVIVRSDKWDDTEFLEQLGDEEATALVELSVQEIFRTMKHKAETEPPQ